MVEAIIIDSGATGDHTMKLFVVYKAFKMATLILLFQNDSIFNLSLVNDEILSVLVTSIPFFFCFNMDQLVHPHSHSFTF